MFAELRIRTGSDFSGVTVVRSSIGLTFDSKYNDVGACQFSVPINDAKALGLDAGSVVEVQPNGLTVPNMWFGIDTTSESQTAEGASLKAFTAKNMAAWLADAVVYPSTWVYDSNPSLYDVTNSGTKRQVVPKNATTINPDTSNLSGHSFENATPGFILRTLIDRAKGRGGLQWVDVSSFSGTTSSNGAAWSTTLTTEYSNGTTLLAVIQDLAARKLISFRMEQNQLKVFNYDAPVSFWNAEQILFRRGLQVNDSNRNKDASGTASSVLIAGDDLAIGEVSDSSITAAIGRRRERFVSQTGITDIATLVTLMGNAELSLTGHILIEDTLGIVDSGILPWANFQVGDWVWADIDGTNKNIQIQQISASVQDAGNLQIGLTLGDIISANDEKTQRLLDNITGGGSNSSRGGLPNSPSGKAPKPPTGLNLTATPYRDGNGVDMAQVQVNWTPPTQYASDNTTITDMDRYEVQYRLNNSTAWTESKNVPASNSPLAAFLSNLPSSATLQVRIRAVVSDGYGSNWVVSNTITLPKVTTTPNTPATPTVSAKLAGVVVYWGGTDSSNNAYGAEFARAEVHVSQSSTFTPSASSLVGALPSRGGAIAADGLFYGTTYYAKILVVDKSGNVSAPSAVSTGVSPAQIVNSDVANNSINTQKIQDGAISAAKVANGAIDTNKLTVSAFGDSVAPNGSFEDIAADIAIDTSGAAGWRTAIFPGGTGTAPTFALNTTGTKSAAGNNAATITLTSGSTQGAFVGNTIPIPTSNPDIWYITFKAMTELANGVTGGLQVVASFGDTAAESQLLNHTANHGANVFATTEGTPTVPSKSDLNLGVNYQTYDVGVTTPLNPSFPYKYVTFFFGAKQQSVANTYTIFLDSISIRPVGGSASITNITASKITAGTLSADILVSARLTTADSGARVELSSAGLVAYDGINADPTVNISAMDGSATFVGTLRAANISGSTDKPTAIGTVSLLNSTITTSDFYATSQDGGRVMLYRGSGAGAATVEILTASSGTWVCPSGITSVQVECWGGGGSGANFNGGSGDSLGSGGAGAGGEYAAQTVAVVPGQSYSYFVGAGGQFGVNSTNSSSGGPGGSTTFGYVAGGATAAYTVRAFGGSGGIDPNAPRAVPPASGGSGSSNSIHFAGGAGVRSIGSKGAGGGSSGGTTQAGVSGNVNGTIGNTPPGAGAGGTGATDTGQGSIPGIPGGGAGGGSANYPTRNGARGQIRLTYGGTSVLVASIAASLGTDRDGSIVPAGVSVGNALYAETWTISQSIATGTVTNLSGFTLLDTNNIYSSSQMSSGVWTCPSTGWYDFSWFQAWNPGATAGTNRTYMSIFGTNIGTIATMDFAATSSGTPNMLSVTRKITAGDTLRFQTLYGATSPSPRTAYGNLTIIRR